jgi:glucoamylase
MFKYNNFLKVCLQKIYNNLDYSNTPGIIIASPSNDPPYKFHWIRDSALVVRIIIDLIVSNQDVNENLLHLINYIECENVLQNSKTLSGLGEPKFHLDMSPYNEPWGRPQNDGPALRGINMLKIYKIVNKYYPTTLKNIVREIILRDLDYIISEHRSECFDLWEEFIGYHFYTRIVQFKFLLEIKRQNFVDEDKLLKVENVISEYTKFLKHHIGKNEIISSFDIYGNISKLDDASILLAFCHVDFDKEIMNMFDINHIINSSNNLINYFRQKYNDHGIHLIGRYPHDKYYDGHIWIICSLALAQFYIYLSNISDTYKEHRQIAEQIFIFLVSINPNLDLSEQFDLQNHKMLSAEKLTWNYSEIYKFIKIFNQ